MKKVVKSLLSVACVLFVVVAAGKAEAAVHVNVAVGVPAGPPPPVVVQPCPPPVVVHPCPPPAVRCQHPRLRHPRHCAPKPPRPVSHAHKAPGHRHPAHGHGRR